MRAQPIPSARPRKRLLVAVACVLAMATSMADARMATPGIRVPSGFQLASRLKLATDVYRYTIVGRRPAQRVHVVRAPVGAPAAVRLGLARGRIAGPHPRLSRTSAMCRAATCLAGINGSFFRTSTGRPLGAIVMNGEPVQSSRSPKDQIVIAPDGSMSMGRLRFPTTIVARYPKRVTAADLTLTVDGVDQERVLGVEGVNVYRKEDQTVLYTSRWGPSTPRYRSGVDLIARVVQPSGRLRVDRPTTVRPVALEWHGGNKLRSDQIVLSARGDGADALVGLWRDIRSGRAREELLLTVATSPPAWQSLAGRPVLLRNGKVQNTGSDWLSRSRQPRTVVGWNADGDLLLVTIDGRQPGAAGMSLREAARFMRRLGAVGALNLDGGGSTTYVERGKVRNRPSDAVVVRGGRRVWTPWVLPGDRVRRRVERPVSTAVMLVRAS